MECLKIMSCSSRRSHIAFTRKASTEEVVQKRAVPSRRSTCVQVSSQHMKLWCFRSCVYASAGICGADVSNGVGRIGARAHPLNARDSLC